MVSKTRSGSRPRGTAVGRGLVRDAGRRAKYFLLSRRGVLREVVLGRRPHSHSPHHGRPRRRRGGICGNGHWPHHRAGRAGWHLRTPVRCRWTCGRCYCTTTNPGHLLRARQLQVSKLHGDTLTPPLLHRHPLPAGLLIPCPVIPRVLHPPDCKGSHIANGTVVLLRVPSLRGLEVVTDVLVCCIYDSKRRLEPLFDESLLHHCRSQTKRRARPHLNTLKTALVDLPIRAHPVHRPYLPVLEPQDVVSEDRTQRRGEATLILVQVGKLARPRIPLAAQHVGHNAVVLDISTGIVVVVLAVP
mmetsp:Transcript_11797/g.33216  ORF Transcript_11797/g.33216 Transcript_11797/m.33216 type:complete len:301 (-) Transcript_11797:1276-2178(-)